MTIINVSTCPWKAPEALVLVIAYNRSIVGSKANPLKHTVRNIMDFVDRFSGGSAAQRFSVDTLLKWTDLCASHHHKPQ
jgi:hypothetical protein